MNTATNNKHWCLGRAVERAFADKGATFNVYQKGNEDVWAVRDAVANHPHKFVRRFAVRYHGYGYAVVQEFGA